MKAISCSAWRRGAICVLSTAIFSGAICLRSPIVFAQSKEDYSTEGYYLARCIDDDFSYGVDLKAHFCNSALFLPNIEESIRRQISRTFCELSYRSSSFDISLDHCRLSISANDEVAAWVSVADIYLRFRDFPAAISLSREGISLFPDNRALRFSLLHSLEGAGETTLALEELERFIIEFGQGRDTFAFSYRLLLADGKLSDAVSSAEEFVREYPNLGVSHLALAESFAASNMWEEANAELRLALASSEPANDLVAARVSAIVYAGSGDYESAATALADFFGELNDDKRSLAQEQAYSPVYSADSVLKMNGITTDVERYLKSRGEPRLTAAITALRPNIDLALKIGEEARQQGSLCMGLPEENCSRPLEEYLEYIYLFLKEVYSGGRYLRVEDKSVALESLQSGEFVSGSLRKLYQQLLEVQSAHINESVELASAYLQLESARMERHWLRRESIWSTRYYLESLAEELLAVEKRMSEIQVALVEKESLLLGIEKMERTLNSQIDRFTEGRFLEFDLHRRFSYSAEILSLSAELDGQIEKVEGALGDITDALINGGLSRESLRLTRFARDYAAKKYPAASVVAILGGIGWTALEMREAGHSFHITCVAESWNMGQSVDLLKELSRKGDNGLPLVGELEVIPRCSWAGKGGGSNFRADWYPTDEGYELSLSRFEELAVLVRSLAN
jgi:tetratricopeptide (TPR) repeat protein